MANPNVIRVPYINPSGRFRPYLEIIFSNLKKQAFSSKTIGLVDSGADQISIPYSLGKQLQLEPPTKEEKIKYLNGISGKISYLERSCEIYLVDTPNFRFYKFDEPVMWIHPDREIHAHLDSLMSRYNEITKMKNEQAIPNTPLAKSLEDLLLQIGAEYSQVIKFYEGEVLLGRAFFDNFEFIQFFHRDRNNESKCFFNYKLSQIKKTHIIPFEEKS